MEKDGRKALTDAELRDFMSAVKAGGSAQDQFAFPLVLFCGLRVQEAVNVKMADFDERTKQVTIRGLKGGRTGRYELDAKLWRLYKAWLRARRPTDNPFLFPSRLYGHASLTPLALQLSFKRYAKEAGLSAHFSVHALRHTCAMIRVRAGTPIVNVRNWIRHMRISSTEIYFEEFHSERDGGVARSQFSRFI